MKRQELIEKYIKFFKSKNHKEIKNSSLIPENDPTVLFTTAGMHPLVPYLLGQKHPSGKRLVNVQRCIRTQDIEEVGDSTHLTFFEMLGNWSLGDYFKKEAIEYSFEFLTKILKIPPEKIAVSIFEGDKNSPRDEESAKIWASLGIKKIKFLPKKDNWWGPAGETGPCGPDTEMFYWKSNNPIPENFNPEDKNWMEIWNDVLMGYEKNKKEEYIERKQKNIDTGMGVERTITILNNLKDVYESESFIPIIKEIEKLSNKKYIEKTKEMRIIADHIKASCFIISDGISPSNSEQGYVLRRLIRRSVRYGREISLKNFTKKIAKSVFPIYPEYENLQKNKEKILEELEKEENKFNEKLEQGIKLLEKLSTKKELNSKNIFLLYQSYGFPLEMTLELLKEKNSNQDIEKLKKEFQKELKKHQELSRKATQGKFKSGLSDNSDQTKKLHTATHLLNQALKIVLKNNKIHQKGSNINKERLRFDFNFPRKLTPEEIKEIENLINKKIKEEIPIKCEEMNLEEAKKQNAEGVFDSKYDTNVKVFSIGNFSKEICAGPHVKNTKELGKFKIKKEESSSSGVRRIKAILEN